MRDEEHAHALGADEADGELNLVHQLLGAIVKQQVRLVKEEHHLRQLLVAALGQQLVQLTQHPQHEGRVQRRPQEQFVRRQDVDHAVAVLVAHKPVVDAQRRLTEEIVAALILQHGDGPLDGADGGLGDVAVAQGIIARVLAHVGQHGAQVLQVNQQHAFLVRDAEHQVQHARLGVVELQHAGQQQRPHLADRGAHRVARLAKHIPERHRAGAVREVGHPHLVEPAGDALRLVAGLGQAAQVALDVGHEYGHPQLGETLGQHLQGDRLARARGTRNQPVAVGHLGQHGDGALVACTNPNLVIQQHVSFLPIPYLDVEVLSIGADQHHCPRGNAFALSLKAQLLGGGGLDGHPVISEAHGLGQVVAHLLHMGQQLGPLGGNGDIRIIRDKALQAKCAHRVA